MNMLFRGLHVAYLAGLVCAMAAAGPAGAAAQSVSNEAALKGAASGTDEGLAALRQYLAQSSGRPEQMEQRANGLIKALAKTKVAADPAALQEAIIAVAQAARQALFATPIARVKMLDNFRLSPRAYGFDFGPPDSAAMQNFQHVTAKDKRLAGANRRALRRPSNDELLSDGVVNVEKFTADIPNGKWRVVLLTDDLGIGNNLKHPLGKKVGVNGKAVKIAQTDPADWLTSGTLSGDGARATVGGPGNASKPGPPPVGDAAKIVSAVRGVLPDNTRYLILKDQVYSNEKINTDAKSAARLIFRDNTILSIGANSTVILDKFVFDPDGDKSKVALSLTRGTMRFVTGDLSKDRYSIRTPTATMGIRGTILEITVNDDGATTTSVVEGEAMVSAAGKKTTVSSGFTTTVARGRPPTRPRANRPAPPQIRAMKTALGPEPDVKGAARKSAAPVGQAAAKQKKSQGGETGGMIIVETEVVDGKLVVDFDKLNGLSTYLTAIIVEPADEKSNFDLREEVGDHYRNDRERLVATNARIDEQIGAVLSDIATAAGPQQIAEALGIEQPAVEPDNQASPN